MSPGSLTEAIVDCRLVQELQPPTHPGYFQARDWIYSQDTDLLPAHTHSIDFRSKTRQRTKHQRGDTKSPYLLNKEEGATDARKDMITALRVNPSGFYYYKQRRLFKPRLHGLQLPSVRGLSPLSPSPRAPVTPEFRVKITSPMEKRRIVTPGRKRSLQEARPTFLGALMEKCAQVAPSRTMLQETEKEKERERQVEERLEWTKQALGEIEDCGPDVLIPFYRHQREAAADFRHDVHRLRQIRQQSDSPRLALQLGRILRRNKNQLI